MKQFYMILTIVVVMVFLFYIPGYSHDGNNGNAHGGHFNPDSLILITVSGTAIIDTSMVNPMYYLDENGDGQANYHLNFGPHWYHPDDSNALRPNEGDTITITGGQHDSSMFDFPTIVVYEINGEFWRDPYNPFWVNMGEHTHRGDHHQNGCNGFAFDWMNNTVQTVSVNGVALVDTTFVMKHYYLDESGDGSPDYFLNFGPPWYEPNSEAARPNYGDQINIVGGLMSDSTMSKIIVYEINDLVWRDSTTIGQHFGGGWMHSNMTDSVRIHDPFDPDDWMQVNPGWRQMSGGHHGGMMPDSLFGRMLEIFPQNIPYGENQNIFAAYEIGMFAENRQNIMWQDGGCGGHMNFESNASFQLHYNDIQLHGFDIDENTIQVKYWDDQSSSWITVHDAIVDPVDNTITFEENTISNFIILTGDQVTGVDTDENRLQIEEYVLEQNYPNPFNPSTTIQFTLKHDTDVILNIYNVLGQRITTLLNGPMTAGTHTVDFNAEKLSSGIYFYELKVDDQRKIMKMNLIK